MLADLVELVRAGAESLGPFSILALAALDNLGLPKASEPALVVVSSAADYPLPAVVALCHRRGGAG